MLHFMRKIGVFGGSFDPPHIGHKKIAKISVNKLQLNKLYWVVARKNPFKKKTFFSIEERLMLSKRLLKHERKIITTSFRKKIKSNRTSDVVNFLNKKYKDSKIYLIIGSDNLIKFHMWKNWMDLTKKCTLVVFSRKGFDKKSKKTKIVKYLNNKKIIFVKNKQFNFSSSNLRKSFK